MSQLTHCPMQAGRDLSTRFSTNVENLSSWKLTQTFPVKSPLPFIPGARRSFLNGFTPFGKESPTQPPAREGSKTTPLLLLSQEVRTSALLIAKLHYRDPQLIPLRKCMISPEGHNSKASVSPRQSGECVSVKKQSGETDKP